MADVYVNTWAEFLEAVATEGNTVICPSQAIWDMNEIEPEGVTALPTVKCTSIQGNGTEIRNLKTTTYFPLEMPYVQSVNNLHFVNFIADNGVFFISHSGHMWFHGCKFSGLCGAQALGVIVCGTNQNASADRCSFLIDAQRAGAFHAVNMTAKFCRFSIAVPNGTFTMPYNLQWCYVRADTPLQQGICPAGSLACVFDGDMQNVTQAQEPSHTYISIFNKSSMPGLQESEYLKGVTTEQLLNADYLYSIGFPIGVDPEDVD